MKETAWRAVAPRLALLLVLVAWAAAALSTLTTPSPRGLGAPDDEFSARRALGHLEVIATEPRPHGSAANQRTADYIVGLADDLGLHADVDAVPGASSILVSVPGTASTRGVVLTAHFDSAKGALSSNVAWVWRRSWNRIVGRPDRATSFLNASESCRCWR